MGLTFLVIAALVIAIAAGVWITKEEKHATVADITKPLHDIVERLEVHAEDQHVAAEKHDADVLKSNTAAWAAREQRDHARRVAGKVKELVAS